MHAVDAAAGRPHRRERSLIRTGRTPPAIFVPLLTPVLFALVIAPALRDTMGNGRRRSS